MQMAGQPTYGFFGDILKGIGSVAKTLIPGPIDDLIIDTVSGRVGSQNQPGAEANCPPGFQVNSKTGVCEAIGVVPAIQRFLPGGQTGTLPQVPATGGVAPANGYGAAVMGTFGVPALQPVQASTMTLRCPPGSVLGKDNLCYQKGSIPPKFRKWRPGRKPPISAGDWKALQTADRVKNKAKTVAGKAGFTCKRR